MGFANLFRNESREWWGSRRWLKKISLWLLVLNGLVALLLFVLPAIVEVTPEEHAGPRSPVAMGIQAFFQIGAVSLAIGTIILAQGKVIGEKQTGITEWILSKPVARPAYFLAKLAAHSVGILVIMIGIQSAVAYGLVWLANGGPLPLLPFLTGVGGLALHTLFYLTLTMMMGVFAKTRGQVLCVALGSLFGGMFLPILIKELGFVTPWCLPDILRQLALGIPLPLTSTLIPILATAIWSIVFVSAALWKLPRLEF
jgi:ABC-type transport system involved in multi-copper enzyme maturation permease subunit